MIQILRLGHRAGRDERISTHVGLTARQWGADKVVFAGERDRKILESQRDIIDRWGGDMEVEYTEEPRKVFREFEGLKIHLTMYGLKLDDLEEEIRSEMENEEVLLVVGSEKVPRWYYRNADYNISVGNQPHSEIAALAVFMDRFFRIKEEFENRDIEVVPSEDRKLTEDVD